MKYIDADLLRKEIERLDKHYIVCEEYDCGWNNALNAISKFIDTIPEQPSLPTINGWVARDEYSGDEGNLYIGMRRPRRIDNAAPGFGMWCDYGEFMALPSEMFPDLKWEDEPIEVELTIRLK